MSGGFRTWTVRCTNGDILLLGNALYIRHRPFMYPSHIRFPVHIPRINIRAKYLYLYGIKKKKKEETDNRRTLFSR